MGPPQQGLWASPGLERGQGDPSSRRQCLKPSRPGARHSPCAPAVRPGGAAARSPAHSPGRGWGRQARGAGPRCPLPLRPGHSARGCQPVPPAAAPESEPAATGTGEPSASPSGPGLRSRGRPVAVGGPEAREREGSAGGAAGIRAAAHSVPAGLGPRLASAPARRLLPTFCPFPTEPPWAAPQMHPYRLGTWAEQVRRGLHTVACSLPCRARFPPLMVQAPPPVGLPVRAGRVGEGRGQAGSRREGPCPQIRRVWPVQTPGSNISPTLCLSPLSLLTNVIYSSGVSRLCPR